MEEKFFFSFILTRIFPGELQSLSFQYLFVIHAQPSFDSSFAPMQIKDIPDAAHKIVIEKTVFGSGNSDLAAGFHYEIQNVGQFLVHRYKQGGKRIKGD
jgi:hypothetical protein